MTGERRSRITRSLLSWYDVNKRDLPWRDAAEPYAVWVSEIMAQQTRITALAPYYRRFMERFPRVDDLALASEDEVLKAWEGLGYYSRARRLRAAAQKIVSEFNGVVPDNKKELLSLPGVGEYTAGAILSIAFGQAVPAVDGNVLRVFARVENSEADIADQRTKALAADFVREIMPDGHTGHFTQSLMELGALVCVPKNPLCGECPLQAECRAYALGRQRELPVKSPKKEQRSADKTVLILCNTRGEILMRRRDEALLNGLWEFYLTDGRLTAREASALARSLAFTVGEIRPLGEAKHVFTHLIWRMTGYLCLVDAQACPLGYQWIAADEMNGLAMPTALQVYRKILWEYFQHGD